MFEVRVSVMTFDDPPENYEVETFGTMTEAVNRAVKRIVDHVSDGWDMEAGTPSDGVPFAWWGSLDRMGATEEVYVEVWETK